MTAGTFNKNLQVALATIKEAGLDPTEHDFIINIGGATPKPPTMFNKCPCVTSTRATQRAYWATAFRRRLSMSELMRVQGYALH
eukprot:10688472-Alexandrium_andersonii.AAC.1